MASKEADWTMLPDLPLTLIFDKLIALPDFLRFVAVCKEWRLVVTNKYNNNIRRWLASHSKQLPFLMVRSPESRPSLYSLATQQSLLSSEQLYVPYNCNFRCSGSSYGWLAFASGKEYDVEITLHNPFTKDEINDLPHIHKDLSCLQIEYFVPKVILSANPSVNRDDLYVVAIYDGMGELALLKYGQKSWIYIDFMRENLVCVDVIFFRGLLYAVTNNCIIASIDIIGCLNMKKREAPQPIFLQTHEKECSQGEYLVESSQGDLFVVRKFYVRRVYEIREDFRFQVFKVVLTKDGNEAKLEEVKSLGNDALFLGDNQSMSISVLEFPQCQPDSIYYTDDGYDNGYEEFYGHLGPICNGIYNLKDGTVREHYQPRPEDGSHMLPPIWIIPSPKFLGS